MLICGLSSIFPSFLIDADIGFAGWMAAIGFVGLRLLLAINEKREVRYGPERELRREEKSC